MLSRVENATSFTHATPAGPHGSAAPDSSLPFQDLSTGSSVYISCSHDSNLLVFVNSHMHQRLDFECVLPEFQKPCFLIRKETSKPGDKYYDKSLIYRGLM